MSCSIKDEAVKVLKKSGLRVTEQRLKILDLLVNSDKALSPQQLSQVAKHNAIIIDTVTIYRVLEAFLKIGIVHKLDDSYALCSKPSCQKQDHCHHIFKCQKCDTIEDLEVSDLDFITRVGGSNSEIKILNHNFQFFGLCRICNN